MACDGYHAQGCELPQGLCPTQERSVGLTGQDGEKPTQTGQAAWNSQAEAGRRPWSWEGLGLEYGSPWTGLFVYWSFSFLVCEMATLATVALGHWAISCCCEMLPGMRYPPLQVGDQHIKCSQAPLSPLGRTQGHQ